MEPKSHMSLFGYAILALVITYPIMLLGLIWSGLHVEQWLTNGLFLKVSATYAILLIVVVATYLIRREFVEDAKARQDKFMD